MNKKIIAAAVAAFIAAPAAMAASNVTIYGKVRQSLDFYDAGVNANFVNISDKTSRLGLKGSEDLGNGLKAIFKVEYGVGISSRNGNRSEDSGNEFNPGYALISARNAYVGLAGDFGTVLIGRHDHPVKMSTGKMDIFGDTIADNGNFYQRTADLRADGTIAYVSPSFSGLKFAGAIVPGEEGGPVQGADGVADAYSVAVMYNNAGLAASLGYEEADACMDGVAGGACVGAADYEQLRAGIGYTMDALSVNLVYTDIDNAYDSWKVAGKYTMGNNALKAQYWDYDGVGAVEADGWTVGLEHNFSKRTQAQLIYTTADTNGVSMMGSGGGANGEVDVFSLQMNHNF